MARLSNLSAADAAFFQPCSLEYSTRDMIRAAKNRQIVHLARVYPYFGMEVCRAILLAVQGHAKVVAKVVEVCDCYGKRSALAAVGADQGCYFGQLAS